MLAIAGCLCACGDSSNTASDVDAGRSSRDAMIGSSDASPLVLCDGDHQESLESTNNGIVDEDNQIEPTDLVVSGQNDFSICGQIDPSQAGPVFDDVDVYSFSLSGDQRLRLHLQTDTGDNISSLKLALFGAEGPTDIASGILQGTHALINRDLPAGLYWIAVFAKTRGASDPIGYTIDITKSTKLCETVAAPIPNYTESSDGTDHRGNDTFSVDYSENSNFRSTKSDNDAPESTLAVIEDNTTLTISGSSASLDALDDYQDRDSYSITTGPNTEELSVRLRWDHGANSDLDLHIFAAETPVPDLTFGSGATIGTDQDEYSTLAVIPNTNYWLWVGQYNNPNSSAQNYQLE
ncbi:MAG: pre-peptidase C-terminal domain-containing protein, partial [Kofleriaceae bacterium]|nr:pre-peptidase C-terminal domain-containing protein [Kofleriaceae bacterium]